MHLVAFAGGIVLPILWYQRRGIFWYTLAGVACIDLFLVMVAAITAGNLAGGFGQIVGATALGVLADFAALGVVRHMATPQFGRSLILIALLIGGVFALPYLLPLFVPFAGPFLILGVIWIFFISPIWKKIKGGVK